MILTTYIDPRDTPLLTYNFKYRSRGKQLRISQT